ncbi:MAG: hypothetical protein ACRC7G_16130, partial [Beijerinckiaceae bacterium]
MITGFSAKSFKAALFASALALPFAPIGVWLTPPASAQSAGQNVLIENLSFTGKDGAKFSVPKIELMGSNLSQA